MPHPKEVLELVARYPVLRLIGNTPLLRIDLFERELPEIEILAKCEMLNPGGSIKDRPVLRMLAEAMARGELNENKVILDSTSGNAGIAYSMIGSVLGLKVEMVMPENASEERKKRMVAHGARIMFTDPIDGYDEALREVRRRYEAEPGRYFFCDQYGNSANWRAHYDTTAEEILAATRGKLDAFVAGVGTGGAITGCGKLFKEKVSGVRITCMIPDTFPGIEGLKPLGSPGDIVPEILDASVIDERISVSIDEAYDMCSLLAKKGIFVGQSSGAYLKGAYEVAKRIRKGRIVTLFSDTGERYFSTRLWD